MDREWMFDDRLDPRYRKGVEHFVRHAINNAENVEEIYCPCVKCGNNVGIMWIWHGEDVLPTLCSNLEDDRDFERDDFDENYDRGDDLINDLKQSTEDPTQVEMFDRLAGDAIKPVYRGSSFTRLSATLKLYSLKAKNGWSDKSFTSLLQLLSEILPYGNELPKGRISDDKIRHPANSTQWKTIDHLFPEFGSEARNLRIGLCTDGMNPFGSLSSQWSTWPVLLTIYNLPPWLCINRKYLMLSLLISGPKQPRNDIDVYLEPLIDDLKLLWDEGVEVYDAYHGETFNLRTMVFCTINDFPAYGNLSGYTMKGAKACPICEEYTIYDHLVHGGKNVYLCGYVRNQNRPEGCMIQGYVAEEELEFLTDYLTDVESIGLPTSRHEGRIEGQGTLGKAIVTINRDTLDQAHVYILQHMVDVNPYLEKHQTLLSAQNPLREKGG
ncbi:uncharacterized protein LOC141649472 [Silene latifolia]|uniref:uncharacterized protein LOC141649472 n=1 Tax=Silene latifolia TaxID=37657 RepID=UPI003D77F9E0